MSHSLTNIDEYCDMGYEIKPRKEGRKAGKDGCIPALG